MVRVITIAREFGSGGASIARLLADRLGWRLLDRELLDEVARAAKVEPGVVEQFDERCDRWLHRLVKQTLWHGTVDWPVTPEGRELFDAEVMAEMARKAIEEAARIGNCVVVGRGAQCILHGRPDVFHAFLYAPMQVRKSRIAQRLKDRPGSESGLEPLIRENDVSRAEYIRRFFGQEWCNPYLYDIMINTKCGEQAVVEAVLFAAGLVEVATR